MAEIDSARQRIADYIDHIAEADDGLPAEFEDGYMCGLEYALKLMDGDDA